MKLMVDRTGDFDEDALRLIEIYSRLSDDIHGSTWACHGVSQSRTNAHIPCLEVLLLKERSRVQYAHDVGLASRWRILLSVDVGQFNQEVFRDGKAT